MSTSSKSAGEMRLPVRAEGAIAAGLGVLLVASSVWVPRSSSISNLPWKMELFSSVFLVALTASLLLGGKRLFRNSAALPRQTVTIVVLFSAFAVWSAVSAVWAAYPLLSLHHTLTWGIYIALLVVFLYLSGSGSGIRIMTGGFVLTAVITGIVCLIDYLTMIDFTSAEWLLRLRYAKVGEMMITISPVLAILPLYIRSARARWIAFAAAALSWIVVILSLSKAALLFGVVGYLILFTGCAFFSVKKLRKRILLEAAAWAVFTIFFPVLFTALTTAPTSKDYIAGTAGNASLSARTRLLIWQTGLQMSRDHPVVGMGADNFGIDFNRARAEVAAKTVGSGPEIAEDLVLERAHNEFLQILDELGIVGLALTFAAFWYFGFLLIHCFRLNRWQLSPMLWAAIAGMAAFIGSSMVSSFSFRAIQNGIAFFLVFSIAVYEMGKIYQRENVPKAVKGKYRSALTLSFVAAILMLAYSGSKAIGEYFLYKAERASLFEQAEGLCRTSLRFDPGNASAYLLLASRYAAEFDNAKAAALLSEGIDRGLGVSITYSLLAKYQALSGDAAAAEKTLNEAISIFPRSVFLRARFAVFLEDAGRQDDAKAQMDTARSIDLNQANGWYQIIRKGSVAAYYAAISNPNSTEPAKLLPESAVLEYLDARSNFPPDAE